MTQPTCQVSTYHWSELLPPIPLLNPIPPLHPIPPYETIEGISSVGF